MAKELKSREEITLASNLYAIQDQMADLKEQEELLKGEMLSLLKRQGVKSLKMTDGTTFTISHRETLKAKDPEKAMEWAKENYALKLDTTKATAILRRQLKLPSFFKMERGEDYLTIKRGV